MLQLIVMINKPQLAAERTVLSMAAIQQHGTAHAEWQQYNSMVRLMQNHRLCHGHGQPVAT
jgi:hypothetical protein